MNLTSLNGVRNGNGVRRRDRTLVFRLSQDEYESLVAATSESGGRSVSDFIRTAVMATVENGLDHKSTPARVRELEQRVRKLETAYLGLLKEGA
jgi:hypothetical protein